MFGEYMARVCALIAALAVVVSCNDGRVRLERGSLGPASYRVRVAVSGGPAPRPDAVRARLSVQDGPDGTTLRLAVAGQPSVVTELRRTSSGRLSLETVEGVSPSSAGEADLAATIGQLDPPLPRRAVAIRDAWSSTRRISTETLEATLTSRLRIVRFRRVAGQDTAEIQGSVRGRLRTKEPSARFRGSVSGETKIFWALGAGRLAASDTRLVWRIPNLEPVSLETAVEPA